MPSAPTRVLQGLLVGALVTVGFLGFFALVGLPVSYGVGAIARAIPCAGLATGAGLALAGLLTLLGTHLRVPMGAGHGQTAAPAPCSSSRRCSVRPFGRPVRLDTTSVRF